MTPKKDKKQLCRGNHVKCAYDYMTQTYREKHLYKKRIAVLLAPVLFPLVTVPDRRRCSPSSSVTAPPHLRSCHRDPSRPHRPTPRSPSRDIGADSASRTPDRCRRGSWEEGRFTLLLDKRRSLTVLFHLVLPSIAPQRVDQHETYQTKPL